MIQLICDDCFNKLSDISCDIIFTSPPYNRKRNDKYQEYDDTLDDYYDFLRRFIENAKYKKYLFLNVQTNYYNKQDVYKLIGKYADKIQQIFIWEKSNPMPANGHNITNAYEFFIVFGDKPLKASHTYTKNILTTAVNSNTTTKIHKAVMKQEVADWFVRNFSDKGDIICDPFMGLGTTGVSCLKYNRKFIGIEKSPVYFDYAQKRLLQGIEPSIAPKYKKKSSHQYEQIELL
jgi:site-specific DNA-methyltransferase (adenine-specific)